jgi:hypothetical protein
MAVTDLLSGPLPESTHLSSEESPPERLTAARGTH